MMVMIEEVHAHRLERVRYFPRQLIGADDLTQEQRYHRQKLRNHNRFLHGWGVACGCDVQTLDEPKTPWVLRICPGYVLTPQGDEIWIPMEARFDLATCLMTSDDPCAYSRPCPPLARRALDTTTVHLAVRYVECQARPVRVAPIGCGCDDADCEYSRIQDGYEFTCLTELPRTHVRLPVDCDRLCDPDIILPCPECPDDPWVVLATVKLPDRGRPIEDITVTNRRALRATAVLQEHLQCLCEPETQETLTVVGATLLSVYDLDAVEENGIRVRYRFDGPRDYPTLSMSGEINGIEIRFNTALDRDSVNEDTVHVRWVDGDQPIGGTLRVSDDSKAVRFVTSDLFPPGQSTVTLVADTASGEGIRSVAGGLLDGEAARSGWPTGNRKPGGSCVLSFTMTNPDFVEPDVVPIEPD